MEKKETPEGRNLVRIINTTAAENGVLDPLILNPGSHSSIADWILIFNGDNKIHTTAISKYIHTKLKKEYALLPSGQEGEAQGRWILLDYVDVLVNITLPEVREFYELDKLHDKNFRVDPESI